MRHTAAKNPFICLVHPPEGVLPEPRNYLVRPIGSAGEHLLAELWPADKAPPDIAASRETELADLLRIMRDESRDIKTRIEAAEGALRIKDAQSLTINIVKYADAQIPSWPPPSTQAATPVLSPGAGSYSKAQTVVAESTTPAATIYYTTDGTEPTT
jgi:hypothetical protein